MLWKFSKRKIFTEKCWYFYAESFPLKKFSPKAYDGICFLELQKPTGSNENRATSSPWLRWTDFRRAALAEWQQPGGRQYSVCTFFWKTKHPKPNPLSLFVIWRPFSRRFPAAIRMQRSSCSEIQATKRLGRNSLDETHWTKLIGCNRLMRLRLGA